jgi:hypothetical protein
MADKDCVLLNDNVDGALATVHNWLSDQQISPCRLSDSLQTGW